MAGEGPLRELLIAFGVDTSEAQGKLRDLGGTIGDAKSKLVGFAEAIGAGFLGVKVKEFVQGQIETGAHLRRTASMIGTSTDELQALQLATGSAGLEVDDMTTGLRFLNRNLGEAASGTGDVAQTFARLGVHVKDTSGQVRPAGEVMQDIADKMAAMKDPAEKTDAAMKLFGRGGAALIPLLNKGSVAFDDARKSMVALGGGITEGFTEKAEEAIGAQYRLKFAIGGLKSLVAAEFLPYVVKIASKITEWAAGMMALAHETNGLRTAFIAANVGGAVLMFVKLARVLGLAKVGFVGVARALLGFAWPVLLAGALYLVFDDLFTLMTGGESVIGALLDKYEGVGTASAMAEELRGVWEELKDLWSDAGDILTTVLIEGLKSAVDLAGALVRSFMGAAHYAMALGYAAHGNTKDSTAEFKAGDKSFTKAFADVGEAFGNAKTPAPAGTSLTSGGGTLGDVAARPIDHGVFNFTRPPAIHPGYTSASSKPSTASPVAQTNRIDVRVQTGSGDPKAIGSAVSDGLTDAMKKSVQRDQRNAAAALGAGG